MLVDAVVHCAPAGEIVYVVEPVVWLIVVDATPEVQLVVTVPPPLELAIVRSKEAEVSENVPPVEEERVTVTFPAFTTNVSAAEFATIVKFATGEVKETVVFVLHASGAARASECATKTPATARIRKKMNKLKRAISKRNYLLIPTPLILLVLVAAPPPPVLPALNAATCDCQPLIGVLPPSR